MKESKMLVNVKKMKIKGGGGGVDDTSHEVLDLECFPFKSKAVDKLPGVTYKGLSYITIFQDST